MLQVNASVETHVNHSKNDADTIRERQSDPHSHALVLDPLLGCVAFVPDLGMDAVRQLYYDENTVGACGVLWWVGVVVVAVFCPIQQRKSWSTARTEIKHRGSKGRGFINIYYEFPNNRRCSWCGDDTALESTEGQKKPPDYH